MFYTRSLVYSILVVVFSLFLAGCTASHQLPSGAGAEWHLVVIGDSSMWELGDAFASQIEKDTGVRVILDDYSLSSLSAGAVLEVLQTGKSSNIRLESLPSALKEAEVVVMFVNPEDSINPQAPFDPNGCFGCSAPVECRPEAFTQYSADVAAIWEKVFELRAGKQVILRATDLYNPLLSHWQSCQIAEACTTCWENMSAAARQAAEQYSIPFLSRLDAFNGPGHDQDPTEKGYIRDDGEHPTDQAAQYTAELLSAMGYEPVPAP